jgi:two-component system cell cycle sensor histidine kinase/response regulator CckA
MDRQPSHSTPPTDTRHNLGPERLRVEELERRLEESLQECRAYQTAHEWWSALLENAPDHIAVISRAGMIQYVNRAIRDRSPESLQGTDAADLMAPEHREPLRRALRRVFDTGEATTLEGRAGPELGGAWHSTRIAPLRLRDGEVSAALVVSRDDTRRKEAEAELRLAERELERMLQTMVDGMVKVDAEGEISYANRAAERILGIRRGGMEGRQYDAPDWRQIDDEGRAFPPEELPLRRALEERREIREVEHGIVREGGKVTWLSVNAAPLIDDEGTLHGALASFRDVSEHRHDQEERRRLADLVESSSSFIGVASLDGRVLYVNQAGQKMIGLEPGHLPEDTTIELLLLPERRELFEGTVLPAVLEEGEYHGEGFLRSFGGLPPVEVRYRTFTIHSHRTGQVVNLAVVAEDIREQRRMERALEESEERFRELRRLEAIGRLAGGIAHEFNSLMTSVLGYSELSLEESGVPEEVRENLQSIHTSARRAAVLTEELLSFSRRQLLRPEEIELNGWIASVAAALKTRLGPGVRLEIAPQRAHCPVRIDPRHFEKAILRLADNSTAAMPDGGTFTLSLTVEEPQLPGELPLSDYACLAVSDTGCGMDAETRSRAFEPFFTTRRFGEAQGMGLASVYGTVRQSGGHVTVDSTPGVGTTFRIYLPLSGGSP